MKDEEIMKRDLFSKIGKSISEVVKECGNGRNWLCEFVGLFVAIDANNKFEFIDNRIFAFGDKKSLIMQAEELLRVLKEEETEFINW